MRHTAVLLLASIALLCNISYGQQTSHPDTISPCDLGSQYERYDGKVIRLKSEYVVSTHGSALVDERCPDVVINGYKWRNTVCFKASSAANTKTGFGLFSDITGLIIKWSQFPMKTSFEVVFAGKFEVVKERSPLFVRDGYAGGTGFCSIGRSPFMLFVDRVESITFEAILAPTPSVDGP